MSSNISIWKFPIVIDDEQYIRAPSGAVVLHAALQNSIPCIWALVDPSEETVEYTVRVYGTGNPIDADLEQVHVGSIQQGPFVWHIFWAEPR